jgi:hypothetical protein
MASPLPLPEMLAIKMAVRTLQSVHGSLTRHDRLPRLFSSASASRSRRCRAHESGSGWNTGFLIMRNSAVTAGIIDDWIDCPDSVSLQGNRGHDTRTGAQCPES